MKIWKLKWGRLPCRKKKESPYIDSRKTKVHHIMADIEDHGSSGRSRGGARPPLFLDQTEGRRAEKIFFCDRPPLISGSGWPPLHPLSRGLDDRPPLISGSGWPSLHPLSRGLDDRPPPLISGSGWPSLHPLSEGLDPPLGRVGGEVTQATKEMTTYQTI